MPQVLEGTIYIESMYILLELYNLYSPVEKLAPFRSYGFLHTTYIQAKSKRNPASQPGKFQSLYWSRSAETRIPIKMPHGHQAETGLLGTILD